MEYSYLSHILVFVLKASSCSQFTTTSTPSEHLVYALQFSSYTPSVLLKQITAKQDAEKNLNVLCIRPRGYKTFFMLNSTEHEFFPAHKC